MRTQLYWQVIFHSCFVAGSYDHCLKVWDKRRQGSVLSMDHGHPVECVQIFPTGGICISAGKLMDNQIQFFNNILLSIYVLNNLMCQETKYMKKGNMNRNDVNKEAAWSDGQGVLDLKSGLCCSLLSPKFNSSVTLVNSQLVRF